MKYDITIKDESGEELVSATLGTEQPFDTYLAGLLFAKVAGMCDPAALEVAYLHKMGVRTSGDKIEPS